MRNPFIMPSKQNIKRMRPKYLVTNDVLKFHVAILSDPVLIDRFKEVKMSVILIIANRILDLLRLSWNEGLKELIEPFFQQRVLEKVKEAEVDALFTHFLKECDLEGYNISGDYWICLDRLKKDQPGYRHGGFTIEEFFKEVKKNSMIKNRFINSSPASILNISRQIMDVISCKEPQAEYSEMLEKHRNMKITNEEFDEFLLLFFRMCAPNSQYLSNVWDNIVKIKKAMIPESLIVEKN